MAEASRSYRQILRASSIMGAAAAINLILGMVRVKTAALFVGIAGVGLLASFTAIQTFFATLAGLGIQSSGVREVADAVAKDDDANTARTVAILRRVCWLSGLSGLILLAAFSPLLSRLTFGDYSHVTDIAALGVAVFFMSLTGGQMAFIQGVRRIGDIARYNVISALVSTAAATACYIVFRLNGMALSLVLVAGIQFAVSTYFARRVPVPKVQLTWRETIRDARGLVGLGIAFMWGTLLTSGVSYITVTLIARWQNIEAVGLYSAAFALSAIFVNFVLGAMATDFYPRLVGQIGDHAELNRLVNEQTEIGLLLAIPGLFGTLALAPWVLHLLYSHEFVSATGMLEWFVFGCLGQVISWPLGFLILSLGRARWFLFTETVICAIQVMLVAVGLLIFGLEGVSIAFLATYILYTVLVNLVTRRLTGFRWSPSSWRIIAASVTGYAAMKLATAVLPMATARAVTIAITAIACYLCLTHILRRVGSDTTITRLFARFRPASR